MIRTRNLTFGSRERFCCAAIVAKPCEEEGGSDTVPRREADVLFTRCVQLYRWECGTRDGARRALMWALELVLWAACLVRD